MRCEFWVSDDLSMIREADELMPRGVMACEWCGIAICGAEGNKLAELFCSERND
jgi:hypothetical protein